MNISVCVATYNGKKYIGEQLRSIIEQLGEDDEVVIVDDNSSDGTLDVIDQIGDSRICKYINEKNYGVNRSFELAILKSKNELIFLADQDDIWPAGRVATFKKYFSRQQNVDLITGNSEFIDEEGNSIEFRDIEGVRKESSRKSMSNIFDIFLGKTNYYGCTMAFRRRLIAKICPFPNYIESHDLHIAIAANLSRANLHIDETVLYRRIHSQNNSLYRRSVYRKVKSRFVFILNIIYLITKDAKGKGI